MNMFARFDENPAITLQDIKKKKKRYGRTDGRMDGRTHGHTHARTHGQRENSIPTTNKVCGGYNNHSHTTVSMKRPLMAQIWAIAREIGTIHSCANASNKHPC